jgi:hypothetical protein
VLIIAAMLPGAPSLAADGQADEAQGELQGVVVEVHPATVKNRSFNPAKPPADMPKLAGDEAAVTSSGFGCATTIAVLVIDQEGSGGQWTARVRVTGVKLTTTLEMTVWLPQRAKKKIIDHEQGHRRIGELFYDQARSVAEQVGRPVIGQEFAATAATAKQAIDAAMKEAGDGLCQQYMDRLQRPAGDAQVSFDRLTDHGRNKLPEDKAIKQAVDEARRKKGK